MPSATLQSRINLFESPDLKDWVVPPKHGPASSISSFHSVSLDHTGSSTSASTPSLLDESYEDVSLPVPVIPQQPPKLPQRPPSAVPLQAPPPPTQPKRRPAPPPPPALSKKPSNTSITSFSRGNASSLSRVPPIPAPVRKRYEALFDLNIQQTKRAAAAYEEKKKNRLGVGLGLGLGGVGGRKRQAAGWRGLSIDLTTTPPTSPPTSPPKSTTKAPPPPPPPPHQNSTTTKDDGQLLPNTIIKFIWERSRLPRPVLEAIWLDCAKDPKDPKGAKGTKECPGLGRDAFVKGMWRIEEELRKATLGNGKRGSRRY